MKMATAAQEVRQYTNIQDVNRSKIAVKERGGFLKKLIYVPIIHSMADFGSVKDIVKQKYIQEFGEIKYKEHLEQIGQYWTLVRQRVLSYLTPGDVKNTQIYQDGHILDIVKEDTEKFVNLKKIAQSGSPNYDLIVYLLERGARLMATEDRNLILKEREAVKTAREFSNEVLRQRDQYIANRINQTLYKTGILFIGNTHQIKDKLSRDIQVIDISKTEKDVKKW